MLFYKPLAVKAVEGLLKQESKQRNNSPLESPAVAALLACKPRGGPSLDIHLEQFLDSRFSADTGTGQPVGGADAAGSAKMLVPKTLFPAWAA